MKNLSDQTIIGIFISYLTIQFCLIAFKLFPNFFKAMTWLEVFTPLILIVIFILLSLLFLLVIVILASKEIKNFNADDK